jgi:neopullulanase
MLLLILSGCCNDIPAPILDTPQETSITENTPLVYPLDNIVIDSTWEFDKLGFDVVSSNQNILAEISDGSLLITAPPDYNGESNIALTVTDKCDATNIIDFTVTSGAGIIGDDDCSVAFSYNALEGTNAVFIAGEFNGWNPESHPLEEHDGVWTTNIILEEGSHSYKYVVQNNTGQQWTCDPTNDLFQCDANQQFSNNCSVGQAACNSIAVVKSCGLPEVELIELTQSTEEIIFELQSDTEGEIIISLDGEEVRKEEWDGSVHEFRLPITPDSRHTVQAQLIDAQGKESNLIHIPFWTDDFEWESAVMYFVFVDRFFNGDISNDASYDSNWETGDYLGGDWKGVLTKLDYLEALGVTALWLTAPQNNPEGLYDGDCSMTITGYHGYWPVSQTDLEEHFGDENLFQELINSAHQRGIRVLVDWVGNHTHEEHPWYEQHPDWYTDYHLCRENDNWNQAPETCWFAPYVPSLNYYRSDVIMNSIDDAISIAKKYNIDGFRVDAVKHMPYSVHYNTQSRIEQEIEHNSVGGSMEFYTVGETFSGERQLLNSYIGDNLLDGQFDFSIYWTLLSSLARDEQPVYALEEEYNASKEVYGDALMSNFLGNHDVERFISHAANEVSSLYGDGLCPSGNWRGPATPPNWEEPYLRLNLAWTWLFTHPGTTLIYYGDEIGLPGYHDPDNRQMMYWQWNEWETAVHDHVAILANARQTYPQLSKAEPIVWWGEPDQNVLVYALSHNNEHALVAINRSENAAQISNSLTWANLPTSSSLTNIITNENKDLEEDLLELQLEPFESQIWIWQN